MKKKYFFIALIALGLGSCSLDDVLENGDELNIAVTEAVNPIKVEPGDTVVFKFVASTTKGELSRVQIASEDGIKPLVDKTEFAMIEKDSELSLDNDGYFSRPISTVLVFYPLVIPADQSLRNKNLSINITLTRNDGTSTDLVQKFNVINYINNIVGITMTGKSTAWLYNPTDDITYSMTDYKSYKEKIEIVLYIDASSKYYCLNPAAAETEEIMHELGYADYDASTMNDTKFMGGITLDFIKITEKELSSFVLNDGVDKLAMGNNVTCGFMLGDGRKGYAKHLYKSPNRNFVSKLQVAADR